MFTRTKVLAMKVKLCESCPYTPTDIGPHYSVDATEYCCLACSSLLAKTVVVAKRRRRRRVFRPVEPGAALAVTAGAGPGI